MRVWNGGTQRRGLHRYQSEEIKILNISIPRLRIESTTVGQSDVLESYIITINLQQIIYIYIYKKTLVYKHRLNIFKVPSSPNMTEW